MSKSVCYNTFDKCYLKLIWDLYKDIMIVGKIP